MWIGAIEFSTPAGRFISAAPRLFITKWGAASDAAARLCWSRLTVLLPTISPNMLTGV
jgi:hypothetical protein